MKIPCTILFISGATFPSHPSSNMPETHRLVLSRPLISIVVLAIGMALVLGFRAQSYFARQHLFASAATFAATPPYMSAMTSSSSSSLDPSSPQQSVALLEKLKQDKGQLLFLDGGTGEEL